MDDKTLDLINTVTVFANKMNFPWRFKKFTTESEEEVFGLYVYSYGCDPDCSCPLMYWEWYLADWSEFDGNFPYSYY